MSGQWYSTLTGVDLINEAIWGVERELVKLKGDAVECMTKKRVINGNIKASRAQALADHQDRLKEYKAAYLASKQVQVVEGGDREDVKKD
jgi:hypothetical protein